MTLKDIVRYLFIDKFDTERYKCVILVDDATDDKFECIEEFHISDEYNLKKYEDAMLLDIFMPDDWEDNVVIHVAINL